MKTLSIIFAIGLLSQTFAQQAEIPIIESKKTKDIYIHSVSSNNSTTDVIFVYFNTAASHYIYLNPPGHADAMFIRANGKIYKAVSIDDEIATKTGETVAHSLTCVYFMVSFEKLPASTTSFDLIEGANGTWNFYGVKLNKPEPEVQRFRRDYKFMTPMKDGAWQSSLSTETYFVFNANDDNDIYIYFKESGKKIVLNIVGSISENSVDGYDYQTVKALDEEGAELELKIFDDPKNGVYMIFSQGNLIQYHN